VDLNLAIMKVTADFLQLVRFDIAMQQANGEHFILQVKVAA